MPNLLFTLAIALLTGLSAVASVVCIRRLRQGQPCGRGGCWLVGAILAGSAGLFAIDWLVIQGRWQPLTAHVDGLLLISALYSAAVLFMLWRERLAGLAAFALPLLTLLLAWAICASAWTNRPFNLETLHPVWKAVHLSGVYLGTTCAGIAAIAGAMYLYVQRRLKRKRQPIAGGRLASLETLESLIIRTATLGFVLLTIGLVSGLIIVLEEPTRLGAAWYLNVKILLAVIAWLAYAVVMNVRYASRFRGPRAAWLSIAGLVLLLATYGVAVSLPAATADPGSNAPAAPTQEVSP